MAGVMTAIFLASLDQTVVATAMPRIVADLGGFDRFTWISTAYLVASTTAVPIVGRLSDLYGRKSFFVAGIIVFLVGSVLAGLSQSMNQLILFRAVQGLGGGVLLANPLRPWAISSHPPSAESTRDSWPPCSASPPLWGQPSAASYRPAVVALDLLRKHPYRSPGHRSILRFFLSRVGPNPG